MTDRGTRVRWTTAALVAPAAAALFTGATVWASGHQPATAATPTTTATPAALTADPVVAALREAVDSNTAQVVALRRTVATLQAQAAAIAKGSGVTIAKSSGGSSTRSTSYSSTKRTSSSGSTKRTTTTHKATPAPAPKTQTTTGASGAVK